MSTTHPTAAFAGAGEFDFEGEIFGGRLGDGNEEEGGGHEGEKEEPGTSWQWAAPRGRTGEDSSWLKISSGGAHFLGVGLFACTNATVPKKSRTHAKTLPRSSNRPCRAGCAPQAPASTISIKSSRPRRSLAFQGVEGEVIGQGSRGDHQVDDSRTPCFSAHGQMDCHVDRAVGARAEQSRGHRFNTQSQSAGVGAGGASIGARPRQRQGRLSNWEGRRQRKDRRSRLEVGAGRPSSIPITTDVSISPRPPVNPVARRRILIDVRSRSARNLS